MVFDFTKGKKHNFTVSIYREYGPSDRVLYHDYASAKNKFDEAVEFLEEHQFEGTSIVSLRDAESSTKLEYKRF